VPCARIHKTVIGLVLMSLILALGLSVLTVTPAAAADVISFRASAQSAATQTTHRVTIPTTVRETDGLLLFVTGNRANPVAATPIGWTRVGNQLDTDMETILYSKVGGGQRRRA
jgi:large repetitive protein